MLREGFVGKAFTPSKGCPICRGVAEVVGPARNIHPERAIELSLSRCRDCSHVWVDPMPTQSFLDYLYARASNSVIGVGWESTDRAYLTYPERKILAVMGARRPGRYFELGVGKGLLYERFRSLGWDCSGVEPGDWGEGLHGVVRSLSEVPDGAFDVIVAVDVLEHVADPVGKLRELRGLARSSSTLYAAFPNNQSLRFRLQKGNWRMVRPLGHVHYFSRRSASRMMSDSGFALGAARSHDMADLRRERHPKAVLSSVVQVCQQGDQWFTTATARG